MWDDDTPPATIEALTTINELAYNTTRAVFPDRYSIWTEIWTEIEGDLGTF